MNVAGLWSRRETVNFFEELAVMRVIDREQAKIVAGFGSTTRANARLLALTRAGLLRRFFLGRRAQDERRSTPCPPKGHNSLAFHSAHRGGETTKRSLPISIVQHQLTVNEIYCALKYRTASSGVMFRRWVAFSCARASWTATHSGRLRGMANATGVLGAFLEVDLGHEGLTVWKQKVRNYLQLAVSGEFERRFSQSRFRVLVITLSERRSRSILQRSALATQKIFWFATLESIRDQRLLRSSVAPPHGR